MADKSFEQFQLSLEKKVVSLYAVLNVGAAGAVSSYGGGGITSIVKEATAGQYTITLSDEYYRFLFLDHKIMDDGLSAVAQCQVLQDPAAFQAAFITSKKIIVQLQDFAGAAVNPANGAQVMFEIKVRNTTVGVYDI